ncbi:unnamed protein product, partial [Acidithrix sp. C25]
VRFIPPQDRAPWFRVISPIKSDDHTLDFQFRKLIGNHE